MSEFLKSPCHLLHTLWHGLDEQDGYDSIEADITVEVDPGEKSFYYYATNVFFSTFHQDDGGNFFGIAYAGIQTNGSYDHEGSKWVGKMAIFSAWGGTGGIPEKNGWGLNVPELGSPYSIRLPFSWKEGVSYRLRFGLDDLVDNEWVLSASLTDLESDVEIRIGRIFIPSDYGKLRVPETFHERYQRSAKTVGDIEPSQVCFTNVTANDGEVQSTSWENTSVFSKLFYRNLFWHEQYKNGIRTGAGLPRQ